MRTVGLGWGDWVSLSRIALAFAFVVTFRPVPGPLLLLSLGVAVLAQITDHLDGYLAKSLDHRSVMGWILDSFADRAFYIAAILAFEREYGLNELIVWAFVLRELAYYALRVLIGDFRDILPIARPLALIHAGMIRIAILLGCILPYRLIAPQETAWLEIGISIIFAGATLFGIASLILIFRSRP